MKHKGKKLTIDDRLTLQACIAKKRHYYNFTHANNLANERKVKSRCHLTISNDNLKIIDDIVSNGIEKDQSIHHIYVSNPVLSTVCCEETVRRLCYKGYLTVKSHQLPRYVRYSRKYLPKKEPVDVKHTAKYDGRTYSDFLDLTNRNSRLSVVEFDSVIGKISQTLLTFLFLHLYFSKFLSFKSSFNILTANLSC